MFVLRTHATIYCSSVMRIRLKNKDELEVCRRHGAHIVWRGAGGWIVEVDCKKYGQSCFRFADGTVLRTYDAPKSETGRRVGTLRGRRPIIRKH